MASPTKSPAYNTVVKNSFMTFAEALKAAVNGKHITRPGWPSGVYGLMSADVLHIHYPKTHEKNGTYTWTVSVGDITADDWMIT